MSDFNRLTSRIKIGFVYESDPDAVILGRSLNAVLRRADPAAGGSATILVLNTKLKAGRAVAAGAVGEAGPLTVVAVGDSDWHADPLRR